MPESVDCSSPNLPLPTEEHTDDQPKPSAEAIIKSQPKAKEIKAIVDAMSRLAGGS